jgi:ketosteroid isomerase-like protein
VTHPEVGVEEVAELVRRTGDAASALMAGDVRRYVDLVAHSADYTLMPPLGGAVVHGFDRSDESLDAMARYFQGGTAEVDVAETYASGDLVVLVIIEHNHGIVGGTEPQDYDLRVTLVYRREQSRWRLAHRHADPLVHGIRPELMAALARADTPR